ncbi:hypothetical protein Dimus_001926 [Dionaea muscipula]
MAKIVQTAVGLLAFLLLLWQNTMAQLSCNDVNKELEPCVNYLTHKDGSPSQGCCQGLKDVASKVKSPSDRAAVCECVKGAVTSIPGYDPNLVPRLPAQCSLNFTLPPIDKNTDCTKWLLF